MPNAACHPKPSITQTIMGATMPAPTAAPLATTLVGSARRSLPNHQETACTATGKAGPSAAPRTTRLLTSTAKLETLIIGNNAAAQTTPMTHMMVLVLRRLARNPTAMPETEKSRKNALPSKPN